MHVDKARRLPGVVDILTAGEDPGTSLFARKEVCYEGQKVALVIAEDADIAEDAVQLIDAVRYASNRMK